MFKKLKRFIKVMLTYDYEQEYWAESDPLFIERVEIFNAVKDKEKYDGYIH